MTTFKNWRYSVDEQNTGWLELDVSDSSVNLLRRDVMEEWAVLMQDIKKDGKLAGLCLLSGKERGFVYGADIPEFDTLRSQEDVYQLIETADQILGAIEAMPCATACGIDGVAAGGGLEIALAFDRIVITKDARTRLGFPEIHLGIMPGYGGTGRALRRISAKHVLDMVLSGRLLGAEEALSWGLVDTVIEQAGENAKHLRKALKDSLTQSPQPDFQQTDADVEAAITQAEQTVLPRFEREQTPAPFFIIEHFRANKSDWRALVKTERESFSTMVLGQTSYHLRRVFRLNDAVRKSARGDSRIKHVHVIGAGTMGGDIAAVAALSGFTVSLSDLDEQALDKAMSRAEKLFERRLKTKDKAVEALVRLESDPKGHGIGRADIIIEAVAERLEVKQAVFKSVEAAASKEAILATNTSSILIEDIASALHAPERLIGLHFFNPAFVLPLVEVIYGTDSDPDFIARAMCFTGQLKKMPIKVKSEEGFLVNRALLPYLFRAIELMADGENPDKIDQALVKFGMPMGPIELCDQIGLDVCFDVGQVLNMSKTVHDVLEEKRTAGNLGRKSGSGFYDWEDKKAIRARADYPGEDLNKLTIELLAQMIGSCRIAVREGIVDSADDADIGCILGIGFPAFCGGPLGYADYDVWRNRR